MMMVDTPASLKSRGEANFYPGIKVVLSVFVLHSGAISSPFLFLSVPQGVVSLLPLRSPGDTGVPQLLLPATHWTDDLQHGCCWRQRSRRPKKLRRGRRRRSHRKTPKTHQLSNTILSRCFYVLFSVVTIALLPLLSICFVSKNFCLCPSLSPITLAKTFLFAWLYQFLKPSAAEQLYNSFILPYGYETVTTNFLSH